MQCSDIMSGGVAIVTVAHIFCLRWSDFSCVHMPPKAW